MTRVQLAAHLRMIAAQREAGRIRQHEQPQIAYRQGYKRSKPALEALREQLRVVQGRMTRRQMCAEFKCCEKTIRKLLGPSSVRGRGFAKQSKAAA